MKRQEYFYRHVDEPGDIWHKCSKSTYDWYDGQENWAVKSYVSSPLGRRVPA